MYRQARHDDRLIFERTGQSDFCFISEDDVGGLVPEGMERRGLCLPEIPERDVVRHFINLSQMNFGVDNGIYPLGSCTMKYNPKYADVLSSLPTVASVHPCQEVESVQGSLRLLYELERALCAISDMDAVTLQPAAGAQGEFTGMLITRAYHSANGEQRTEVIVPDSAHGTNPASAAMAGFNVIEIPSGADGCVDLDALKATLSSKTAAFMITNPNTLGLFEPRIEEIAKAVHDVGSLLYYDGANLNAVLGHTSPGKMDFDIVHFNLHKTFATPHGGGGPGAGPVGVKKFLEPFLPVPRIIKKGDMYELDYERPQSIGKVRSYHGNFAVLVRAYAYILRNGSDGLKEVSQRAVLNSNFLRMRLHGHYDIPFGELRKHEFVASAKQLAKEKGVRALDVAKRLLDEGFMAPTIYFPSLVEEALMVEPTETETKESLDAFADAMVRIATVDDPAEIRAAPHNTSVGRVDELFAAKELVLTWRAYQRKRDKF
ncbi:MAG: aminomethyl-transferring glycine dehydrogenase subunit GcvPB [Methanomassiliicoccales archaeon]|nr:MAG: aminomethyl-transferring glycine dehydrogenase subunit GcvPB [Methanomassiliicoccales archaeon]